MCFYGHLLPHLLFFWQKNRNEGLWRNSLFIISAWFVPVYVKNLSLTDFKKKYLNLLFLALIYHCLEKVVAMQLTAVAHKYFINYNLSFVEFSKIVKFYSCFVINVFCFVFLIGIIILGHLQFYQ